MEKQHASDENRVKKHKISQNNKNPNVKKGSTRRYKFKLGDRVKISYLKNQLDREYS